MKMSQETKVRLMVIPIVAMLAVTMVVVGWHQSEENDVSLDRQINAQKGTFLLEDNEDVSENYTTREAIRIDGNDDFAEKAEENNWPGDGSEDDPYVIEGYKIDGNGYESGYRADGGAGTDGRYEYGIYIGNVTDYFVIRECYVYNITAISEYFSLDNHDHETQTPPGIFLFNSQNGRIEKNKVYSSIALSGSSHNVITKNIIRSVNSSSPNGHGITIIPSSFSEPLKNSGHNDVINNTIHNKTIGITNMVYGGTHGESSPANITLENNTFVNVEEEIDRADMAEDEGNNNDSYSVIILGISMIVLAVGWKRVKGSEKNER